MERVVDPENGAILLRHPTLRGIPDLVVEGDGYTMAFTTPWNSIAARIPDRRAGRRCDSRRTALPRNTRRTFVLHNNSIILFLLDLCWLAILASHRLQ